MKTLVNGAVALTKLELRGLREYSTTLPTGTIAGKRWKRDRHWHWPTADAEWVLGTYGEPYPPGHKYHGEIPIYWQPIVVIGRAPRWPCDVRVARKPL